MSVQELFEKYEDEYLEFHRIENKRSNRPDLHAFLLLDELFPSDQDIICSAEHDQFWLDVPEEEIEKIPEDKIIELVRCGVGYDEDIESLSMFA